MGFYEANQVANQWASNSFTPDFSALQAEALLHGRADVLLAPTELVSLSNPYDPDLNEQFRGRGFHDLAYFEGKIYSPQGFGAAVLIDIPTRLLGFGYATPALKILILVALGTISFSLLALGIISQYQKRSVSLKQVVVVLAITVISNPATWLLIPGRAYQVPVAAAYGAYGLGSFLFLNGRSEGKNRYYLWGSLFVGLAFASRPNTLFAVLTLTALFLFKCPHSKTLVSFGKKLLAVLLPMSLVFACWAFFNQARFGKFSETGHAYQMSGYNMRDYPIGSVEFIQQNVNAYLFTPIRKLATFPYLSLSPGNTADLIGVQGHEDLSGLLIMYPLLCIAAIVSLVVFYRRRNYLIMSAVLLSGFIATLILLSGVFKDSTMRYTPDFAIFLVPIAAITLGLIQSKVFVANRMASIMWYSSIFAGTLVPFLVLLSDCQAC